MNGNVPGIRIPPPPQNNCMLCSTFFLHITDYKVITKHHRSFRPVFSGQKEHAYLSNICVTKSCKTAACFYLPLPPDGLPLPPGCLRPGPSMLRAKLRTANHRGCHRSPFSKSAQTTKKCSNDNLKSAQTTISIKHCILTEKVFVIFWALNGIYYLWGRQR